MSIPDSSRVLEPETDVRLAYLNLEGVQFAPSSSNSTSGPAGAGPIGSQGSPSREAMGTSPEAAAEALYGVALTLWLAHPDVVALSVGRCTPSWSHCRSWVHPTPSLSSCVLASMQVAHTMQEPHVHER